jgi:hypothetical protein
VDWLEVVLDWLWEFVYGAGKLLLNPLFYYSFFLAAVLGVSRVKRERKNFHVRVQDAYFELRQLFPAGIVIGIVASIITITMGLVVPFAAVALFVLMTLLLSVTTRIRILSPAYIIGLAFFLLFFATGQTVPIPFFSDIFTNLEEKIYPSLAVLMGILITIEGILIIRNGAVASSPKLLKSKRGQWVGIHEVKRIWAVPIFLLIPGESLAKLFDWWPLFTIGGDTFSLLMVPFVIGFHHHIQSQLPKKGIVQLGKQVMSLGIFTLLFSIGGYWIPIVSIAVVAVAMIGREVITIRHKLKEDNSTVYFSKKNNGIMILGILPDSPAEKMGLQVGELITKVNGTIVYNETNFYEGLIRNRAHCKLEVIDTNGQIRFTSRALYEGEHHELGVLLVSDQEKWGTEAV